MRGMRGLRLHETRRARELRQDQSEAERRLWRRLRSRLLGGFKFIRQEPIGPYFADFVCREEKLVVEIDGATHSTDGERRRDAKREEVLRERGYRIARLCVQRRLACSAGERPAGAKVRSPVVWIAGWRETKTLKPIDNVSLGETTSHRAVTTVNAKVASKVRSPEGRAPNWRAKAAWGAEI